MEAMPMTAETQRMDDLLEQGLEESFPASDTPSVLRRGESVATRPRLDVEADVSREQVEIAGCSAKRGA